MFKYYRVVLGVFLFLDLIIFLNSENRYFPWISFLLILYFTTRFIRNKKSKEPNLFEEPSLKIENTNIMFSQNNNQTTIQTYSIQDLSTGNKKTN